MKIRFEWDPAKAEANWNKHKVRFEVAARVFADPFAWTPGQPLYDCADCPLTRAFSSAQLGRKGLLCPPLSRVRGTLQDDLGRSAGHNVGFWMIPEVQCRVRHVHTIPLGHFCDRSKSG